MTLAQLTRTHFRLRQELVAAYSALPWNTRRIERLSNDIARTGSDIAGARADHATDMHAVLCPQTSHAWLGMFAAHLMHLRPSMNTASAVKYAVASFHHAEGLDPRRAAELLVFGEPCAKTETAKQVVMEREPQSARYETMFAAHA